MTADAWLNHAQEDFAVAKKLWPTHAKATCFHLQQTWEKCFKAILIHNKTGLVKTHDIRFLAKRAGDIQTWNALYDTLTRFYILARYPSQVEADYDKEIIQEIIETTQEVIEWTRQSINK